MTPYMPRTSPSARTKRRALTRQLGPTEITRRRFLDLGEEPFERLSSVLRHFAEEEVERLNVGRAFVERVDLLIADVLLDRKVLAVPRPTVGLERKRELAEGPVGAVTFHERKEHVVQLVEIIGRLRAVAAVELDLVLHPRGIEAERAHPFGVCLLAHQHAANVGVADDLHPR